MNGRACVSARPDLLTQLTAVGKPPASALVVGIGVRLLNHQPAGPPDQHASRSIAGQPVSLLA